MPRTHTEYTLSAVLVPWRSADRVAERQRCGVGRTIIGDRAFAEKELRLLAAERPDWSDFQIHEWTSVVWSDFDERQAFEKAETARLRGLLRAPPEVKWEVCANRPDDVQLALYCQGAMVLVAPTQEAIDDACKSIAFLDRSTGSTGESWWSEEE